MAAKRGEGGPRSSRWPVPDFCGLQKTLYLLSISYDYGPKMMKIAILAGRRCKKKVPIKPEEIGEVFFATPLTKYCHLSLKVCKIERSHCKNH